MRSIVDKLFFCYSTGRQTVNANSTSTPTISFANDSDFILKEIRNTTQAAGAIMVQFSLASGENFSNVALDSLHFAVGLNGIRFFDEVRIPANTQMNIQMQNTTGGNLVHEVEFWGYKVDCR